MIRGIRGIRGIRRLAVYAAATGLLAAGAVSASVEVAHADNFAAACGSELGLNCTLDATIASPGSITVSAESGRTSEEIDVNWTVTCIDSTGSQSQVGATDRAVTPLSVPLAPLPPTAADGQCSVSVIMSLPNPNVPYPPVDYTGTLTYTPTGSSSGTSSAPAVHPIVGFGGMCVDDKGNSSANRAKIQIWSCSGSSQAENWKFSGGEFIHNGKCLSDKGAGGSGSPVILYSCTGGSNQKWTRLSNGELKMKAHGGTLCLSDPRSSTKNGTGLIVHTCGDEPGQNWSLP
jgi:hypothetical protein